MAKVLAGVLSRSCGTIAGILKYTQKRHHVGGGPPAPFFIFATVWVWQQSSYLLNKSVLRVLDLRPVASCRSAADLKDLKALQAKQEMDFRTDFMDSCCELVQVSSEIARPETLCLPVASRNLRRLFQVIYEFTERHTTQI